MINISALENKLTALRISGKVVNITENIFYTCYEINFLSDITLNKIRARLDDISLFFGGPCELETAGGSVYIKVKKQERNIVSFAPFSRDVAQGIDGQKIPLIIGMTEDGKKFYYDLVKCPHILAGGSTGSGKSVFMHNCILSLIYSGMTELALIDVKRVEFSIYENLPHLCHKIAYTSKDALELLKDIEYEMDRRYSLLQEKSFRNIDDYRNAGGRLNYIGVIIDELADLMLSNKKIEYYLTRIAQLGRAAGIHLIVATQRPDAQVISGLIRANIPTRVCFAVQKATDSRIILDMSGGEKLRGAGDGIFLAVGSKNPIKFQSPFIDSNELLRLVDIARHCND